MKHPILAALAAAAMLPASAAESADVLARVGDVEVTVADVRPRLEALSSRERDALAANPELLGKYVRSLIVQQLLLREAAAANWDKRPEIDGQVKQLRERVITQGFLQSVSKPADDYPAAVEIEAAYNANRDALRVPRQFRLAQVFVALPAETGKEAAAVARVKLDEVQGALGKPGADFAAVARAYSEEPRSAANGGEIGWLTVDQIQPGIRDQLGAMTAGSVSKPVRLDDGYHIVKVLEVKEAYIPALSEVRDLLVERLRAARAQENGDAYMAKLLQRNPVAINEIKLGELLPRPARDASAGN